MKILQVLTLLSPAGEFGGPATVAVNQSSALAALGHEVTLIAGSCDGPAPAPDVPGVRVLTFPTRTVGRGRNFSRLVAPSMLRWIRAHAGDFDVAHVHLGRDFVTLPAARLLSWSNVPTHVQTHGMINPRPSLPYQVIDRALTIPAVRDARTAFYLNDVELRKLRSAIGDAPHYRYLGNGVPLPDAASTARTQPDGPPEVLFLARLHPRKRAVTFARVATELAPRFRALFTIAGPDEGDGPAVDEVLRSFRATHDAEIACRIRREPPVPAGQVADRLARATIYVLPSIHEPLPMSVLEAMAAGLPVVVTDTCGFAGLVADADAGLVVDDSIGALSAALTGLLADPDRARAQGSRGRRAVEQHWGITSIARQLEEHYDAVS
ncbi:glycosyltransferase [Gordonia sp. KTR9]|uniref:glycosyltransferase n=1 Tax=Gordonia sp. KTR9 TaxID=337191 RepID=UPI00027DDCBE|nr:glycosyltransferase [Gordonia sp. KTR9]AFR47714.1 Glycosyltransferase [Gordonia sp. KTR9]